MSIRRLKTLIAVADAGGFAAAAEQLNLTLAAVSAQVRQLEAELGVTLFDRAQRPPLPTPAARGILPLARKTVDDYRAVLQAARTTPAVRGKLTVGVIPTAATVVMPAALSSLARAHPEVRVELVSGLTTELTERVVSGELDAAVVTRQSPLAASLVRQPIFQERFMVACSRDLAAAGYRKLLAGQPFIRFKRTTGIGRIIDRCLRNERIDVNEIMELDSVEAIVLMVEQNLGVGLVPEISAAQAASRRIRLTPFGRRPVFRWVDLVHRKNYENTMLTGALYESLQRAPGVGAKK